MRKMIIDLVVNLVIKKLLKKKSLFIKNENAKKIRNSFFLIIYI